MFWSISNYLPIELPRDAIKVHFNLFNTCPGQLVQIQDFDRMWPRPDDQTLRTLRHSSNDLVIFWLKSVRIWHKNMSLGRGLDHNSFQVAESKVDSNGIKFQILRTNLVLSLLEFLEVCCVWTTLPERTETSAVQTRQVIRVNALGLSALPWACLEDWHERKSKHWYFEYFEERICCGYLDAAFQDLFWRWRTRRLPNSDTLLWQARKEKVILGTLLIQIRCVSCLNWKSQFSRFLFLEVWTKSFFSPRYLNLAASHCYLRYCYRGCCHCCLWQGHPPPQKKLPQYCSQRSLDADKRPYSSGYQWRFGHVRSLGWSFAVLTSVITVIETRRIIKCVNLITFNLLPSLIPALNREKVITTGRQIEDYPVDKWPVTIFYVDFLPSFFPYPASQISILSLNHLGWTLSLPMFFFHFVFPAFGTL